MDFGAENDGTEDFFQMFWPTSLSHKIDADSPLWEMSAREIGSKQFEILIQIELIKCKTANFPCLLRGESLSRFRPVSPSVTHLTLAVFQV